MGSFKLRTCASNTPVYKKKNKLQKMVRVEGIEPSSQAWKAHILADELHPHSFVLYIIFALMHQPSSQ